MSVDTVECLVREQFPQWSHLAIEPVPIDGWDNFTFRLGEGMSVRIPSDDAYVPQVEKEHRWLPVLAAYLPLPIPRPVGLGRPGCGVDRPWSVYEWIDGIPAVPSAIDDEVALAGDLAKFLTALHEVPVAGGPPAGAHSFHRGGPLSTWDASTRSAIRSLDGEFDLDGALDVWDRAVGSRSPDAPVWVHGDVAGSNLLLVGGRLHAVIDFGCCAVGDPACDLAVAWTMFGRDGRRRFADGVACDPATWERARGWALWKALVTSVGRTPMERLRETQRFRWRHGVEQVIAEVITDDR